MKKISLFIVFIFLFCYFAEAKSIINNLTVSNIIISDMKQKIMPLGDSITRGAGFGYRGHLQDELGINKYRIVGSFTDPDSDQIYDVNHEGVSGERTDQIESRVDAALDTHLALDNMVSSSILLHAGTNDIIQSASHATMVNNIEDIINLIFNHDSILTTYVALIIPSTNTTRDDNITLYNALLKTRLESLQSTRKIIIVDMNSTFKNDTFSLCSGDWNNNCMIDTNHPNDLGYQAMGKQWESCISDSTNINCNGN